MSPAGLNKLQGDIYGCYTALRAPALAGQTAAGFYPSTQPEAQMHLHLPQMFSSGALQVPYWPDPAPGCRFSMLQSVEGPHAGWTDSCRPPSCHSNGGAIAFAPAANVR